MAISLSVSRSCFFSVLAHLVHRPRAVRGTRPQGSNQIMECSLKISARIPKHCLLSRYRPRVIIEDKQRRQLMNGSRNRYCTQISRGEHISGSGMIERAHCNAPSMPPCKSSMESPDGNVVQRPPAGVGRYFQPGRSTCREAERLQVVQLEFLEHGHQPSRLCTSPQRTISSAYSSTSEYLDALVFKSASV